MRSAQQRVVETPAVDPLAPANGDAILDLSQHRGVDRAWRLWDARYFLWRVTLWGLLASTLIAFVIPKRFQSTTRLMPPDAANGSSMAMLAALAGKGSGSSFGAQAADMLGIKNNGALFIGILRSDTLEDRVIGKLDLKRVYGARYAQDARKVLAGSTDIVEDRQSGIITITCFSGDPHRAAAICAAYVDELNRLVAELSTSAARRERIFIEQRLEAVKSELASAAKQFSEFASKNTVLDISEQTKAMVESAATLQGQLIAAQSELQGLEQIYTDNNVRVRSLRARVAELKDQLNKLSGNVPPLSPDQASVQQLYPSIRQLPLLGVRWADLYRQTKTEEAVYGLLTEQYELAKIQEAKEIPTVKVLDAAAVPERKTSPSRLLIMMLGAALSFGVAVAFVLGTAAWRQIDGEDPRKMFVESVGGAIWMSFQRRISNARARLLRFNHFEKPD